MKEEAGSKRHFDAIQGWVRALDKSSSLSAVNDVLTRKFERVREEIESAREELKATNAGSYQRQSTASLGPWPRIEEHTDFDGNVDWQSLHKATKKRCDDIKSCTWMAPEDKTFGVKVCNVWETTVLAAYGDKAFANKRSVDEKNGRKIKKKNKKERKASQEEESEESESEEVKIITPNPFRDLSIQVLNGNFENDAPEVPDDKKSGPAGSV